MSVREDIAAVLTRYDDDAWAALANRGLLRRARKDLGALDVRVVGEHEDRVEVGVGDVTVQLGLGGPAGATCSCPSAVICQHVLTAALWLAATAQGGQDEQALHAELMALDAATLTAHAGLAGYRWAHQLLDDADVPPIVTREGYLTVTFPRRGLTARYLGGGLAAVVLDQTVPHVERFRVAAVLAWQRAHGLVLAPPAPPQARTGAPSEAAESLTASRQRLRPVVAGVLRDAVRVGVSHLSPSLHERLVTAAVWAQGVEYHRLAALLRRIADEVELLLVRSAGADDLALLDDLALAHALVAALESAAGREPAALLGRARAAYDPVTRLDLVGLGGRPWRTGGGYHGLTCLFWDADGARMLTWTDARPVGLAGFSPRARWLQAAPWSGLPTAAAATGRRIRLTHAQVSADGRISGVESTSASVSGQPSAAWVDSLPVREVWADLALTRPQGLRDVVDQSSLWTAVRPVAAGAAQWDAVTQTLRWPLLDAQGDTLLLELPWSPLHAHAISRVEAIGATLPAGACVVARVQRVRGRLVGEPLSVLLPGSAADAVDALHFDPPPGSAPGSLTSSALVDGLLAVDGGDRPTAADEDADDAPGPVPAPVAALRSVIELAAQRGCTGGVPGAVHGDLARAHAQARGVGLALFGEPDPALDPAESLLRSLYLVQQVERAVR